MTKYSPPTPLEDALAHIVASLRREFEARFEKLERRADPVSDAERLFRVDIPNFLPGRER
jgi:hypothetical protein